MKIIEYYITCALLVVAICLCSCDGPKHIESTRKEHAEKVDYGIMIGKEITDGIHLPSITIDRMSVDEALLIINPLIREQLVVIRQPELDYQITNKSTSETKISLHLVNVSIRVLLEVITEQARIDFLHTRAGVELIDGYDEDEIE